MKYDPSTRTVSSTLIGTGSEVAVKQIGRYVDGDYGEVLKGAFTEFIESCPAILRRRIGQLEIDIKE